MTVKVAFSDTGLGFKITNAPANSKAVPGDIIVRVVYLQGTTDGQADIIFDSNWQLKSVNVIDPKNIYASIAT